MWVGLLTPRCLATNERRALVSGARHDSFHVHAVATTGCDRVGFGATVTCGSSAFIVARPGQKVTCSARLADGTTRQVEVLVRGVDGTITIIATT